MTNTNSLFLYEEIMLLALQDEEGTIGFGLNYSFAVGAAVGTAALVIIVVDWHLRIRPKGSQTASDVKPQLRAIERCRPEKARLPAVRWVQRLPSNQVRHLRVPWR